jgi:putative oxidoreductase
MIKPIQLFSLALRVISAAILFQTLYFKFTAHPESVYIFRAVGIEPWGRIFTGIAELIAGILLLLPRTVVIGAFISAGLMAGALASHIFVLGIVVRDDGGQLFIYACVVFVSSLMLMYLRRADFVTIAGRIKTILPS